MSVTVSSNANAVAADLGRQSAQMTRRLIAVVREAGKDLEAEWVANATETAGAHGVHYPRSIKARPTGPLEVTIAPWSGKQSGMSCEFGSRNQPPHLDGQRALDTLHKMIERRIEAALVF